jgi:hypothetical protein
MWIWREDYRALRADLDETRDSLVEQRTRATVLTEQAITHRTQTAFLIARINQLEKERAIMLRQITKLDIPVPELAAIAATPVNQTDILAAMGSSMFEDMGDDEARRQGVKWDAVGAVDYQADGRPPLNGRLRG